MPDAPRKLLESPRKLLAELKVPAEPAFVSVAKRVAASLGGQLGFNLEEIDELTIAVAQSCASMIEQAAEMWGDDATLKVTYRATDRGIAIELDALAPESDQALPATRHQHALPATAHSQELEAQRALARDMIRLFVNDFRHQVDSGRGEIRFRMVKYRIS